MVVPLMNIPVLSVVLLLAAGILIGHLIWYRDRSEDDALSADLRAENNELQDALHEHKQAYVELEADLEDRRKGWEQLKATNLQLEQAQRSSHQDLTEIHNELARLQQLKDQAFHDLDQERQQRRAMQEALSQSEDHIQRSSSQVELLRSQVESLDTERRNANDEVAAEFAAREKDLQSHIDEATQERNALAQERDALLHRLEASKVDAQTIATLRTDHEALRQQLIESQETLGRLQSELRQREEDLVSLRQDRDEALQQSEEERTSRAAVETRMGNVDQLLAQRDAALAQTAEIEQELSKTKEVAHELSEQLDQKVHEAHVLQNSHEEAKLELKQETDVLRQRLAALTQEHDAVSQVLIDERSRLSSMESENHRLASMAAEAESIASANNKDLHTNLARKQVELDTLRTELEDIASQLGRERHQREHLQTVLHEQKTSFALFSEERKQWATERESLAEEKERLATRVVELTAQQVASDNSTTMVESLTVELEQVRQQLDSTTQEKAGMVDRIDELNSRLSEQTSKLAELQATHEDQIKSMDRLQETHRTAITGRMDLETEKDRLEQNVERLQHELDEVREVKTANHDLKTRLDRLVAQRDEAIHAHAEQKQTIDQLEQNVRELEDAQSSVAGQQEELTVRSAELESLRQAHTQLQSQATETSDQLRRVTVERDSQRDALVLAEERMSQLESRAKSNEETIRNLRRERAAVLANSRQPSSFTFGSLATRSVPEQDSGGRMRRDEVLGMVYTQPPKHKDDLKRISGIAQVLEKKLNAFGVYTYRQIMEWDDVAVAEFSKLLSFRDRIERDDWIGQARNLQYEHYGRAA